MDSEQGHSPECEGRSDETDSGLGLCTLEELVRKGVSRW